MWVCMTNLNKLKKMINFKSLGRLANNGLVNDIIVILASTCYIALLLMGSVFMLGLWMLTIFGVGGLVVAYEKLYLRKHRVDGSAIGSVR